MHSVIERCRICGNSNLVPILDLGEQFLSGVFPKNAGQKIASGPLELVKCSAAHPGDCCGLVQLRHTYPMKDMYAGDYGYRSALNPAMAAHLHQVARKIVDTAALRGGDTVVDIGSNDATLLRSYPLPGLRLVGVDLFGEQFRRYYPAHVALVPEEFSAEAVKSALGGRTAKAVTSIAMFYDLGSPLEFMRQVHEILDDEGIWLFEQSYLPSMLRNLDYGTICHEHREYYSLRQIRWMTDRAGFKIIALEFNGVNGGSMAVTVAKRQSSFSENTLLVERTIEEEEAAGVNALRPYRQFEAGVREHRKKLRDIFQRMKSDGRKIFGYGASTKGNTLLQTCALTRADLPYIAEVNPDKIGCSTPGTGIPIISEEAAKAMHPDGLFILPWHFRDFFIRKEQRFLSEGGMLLMPFPDIEIIGR